METLGACATASILIEHCTISNYHVLFKLSKTTKGDMKQTKSKLFLCIINYIAYTATLLPATSFATEISVQKAPIVKIESLSEISDDQPPQTVFFFNLTNTLFDSPYMLGSRAWRKYIAKATQNDSTCNWHDFFTLFVAKNLPIVTIEEITSPFLEKLQMKGYGVFGLTGRERNKWYDTPASNIDLLTVSQMKSIGIDFTNNLTEKSKSLTTVPEYYEGIFFADIEPKGEYLRKLFKNAAHYPAKVIFVDDKQKEAESMATVLSELGIDHECYWYTATEKNAGMFDPLITNIQLYYLWTRKEVLSDAEAAALAKENPGKTAEYYLQALLEDGSQIADKLHF